MQLDPRLLEILACPQCHAALRVDEPGAGARLHPGSCGLAYPVRDDIPVLLIDEARRPGAGAAGMSWSPPVDDSVLDDRDALELLDQGGMLRAIATSGAQVRKALVDIEGAGARAAGRGRAPARGGRDRHGRVGHRRRRHRRGRRADLPGARRRAPWPPAARLGRPDGPRGGRVVLRRDRGDPGRRWTRRCAAAPASSRSGAAGSTLAARAERGPGAAPAGGRAGPHAARQPVGARHPRAPRRRRARASPTCPARSSSRSPTPWTSTPSAAAPAPTARQPGQAGGHAAGRVAARTSGASSDVASVAAARCAAQLAENAKYPAVHGALTEVHHNQVVVWPAGSASSPPRTTTRSSATA